MNIISEEQAAARLLALPASGLLEGLPSEFIDEMQAMGAFVEYNQQVIVSSGEMMDYVSCIVAGRVKTSRLDRDYAKVPVARLRAGDWFGEVNLFTRAPSLEEIFADGEVVLWTISPDRLRDLFFAEENGVQLLYNVANGMAQKFAGTSARTLS